MIEGLTLCASGGTYFWNDDVYYNHVLPKISEYLTKDELFLVSKWEDVISVHDQKLYSSNIKNISIVYDDEGLCNITMSVSSYRLSLDIVFYGVSNFRFFQDDDTGMFHEIFSVYIIEKYIKEKWHIIKNKRFYFLCPLFPVEDRAFHFIEYDCLKIENLLVHKVVTTEDGVIAVAKVDE